MTPITMAYLPTTSRPQPGKPWDPVLGDVTWRATPSHGTVPQQPREPRGLGEAQAAAGVLVVPTTAAHQVRRQGQGWTYVRR